MINFVGGKKFFARTFGLKEENLWVSCAGLSLSLSLSLSYAEQGFHKKFFPFYNVVMFHNIFAGGRLPPLRVS